MRVVMLTAEAFPYAKTGGLADVLAALPQALAARGVEVTVVLPAYRGALAAVGAVERLGRIRAPVASRMEPAEILRVPGAPVPTIFVHAPRYFDRPHLYGPPGGDYPDNAERFVFFCRAALEWLRTLATPPDVLHAHDWQAALAPTFLRATAILYPELARLRTVQTIHNLAYQGRFWAADWHLLNVDPRYFVAESLEFYGFINFLKGGLVFADALTTVSPRYAAEIQTQELGEGLDGVVRARAGRLRGILNGIDYRVWNPATDTALPARYDVAHLEGKAACKAALQAELGLQPDPTAPLLAMITRLASQKGVDVVLAAAPTVLAESTAQLAVLGAGDPGLEAGLRQLAASFPGRVGLRLGYDEPLAHRIEAGADIFVMPSRYEPCGLNQLYSLRYGTVPVVHDTGGLHDTVEPVETERGTGTGLLFAPCTADALLGALREALALYAEPQAWRHIVANGMRQDFSWERSAAEYAALYATLPGMR